MSAATLGFGWKGSPRISLLLIGGTLAFSSLRKNREIEPFFSHVRVGGSGDALDYWWRRML